MCVCVRESVCEGRERECVSERECVRVCVRERECVCPSKSSLFRSVNELPR